MLERISQLILEHFECRQVAVRLLLSATGCAIFRPSEGHVLSTCAYGFFPSSFRRTLRTQASFFGADKWSQQLLDRARSHVVYDITRFVGFLCEVYVYRRIVLSGTEYRVFTS